MNPISWVDIIGMIVIPILGYGLVKLNSLQQQLSDHKLDMAKNYSTKVDFKDALDKLELNIEKISIKLDTLVERRSHDRKDDLT